MEQEIKGKVQKINDEDYEIIKIIESVGTTKAVEWYRENYDCDVSEAIDAIKAIGVKYNVNYKSGGDSDEDSIIMEYQSSNNLLHVVKWYKEKQGLGLKESKDKVEEVLYNAGLIETKINTDTNSGNGCMITIIIAITSTLSVFFMI